MADAAPKDVLDNTMSKIVERHANLAPHQQPIFLMMSTEIVEGDSMASVVIPATVCGRGRLQGSTKFFSQKSTERDPLIFEYVNTEGVRHLEHPEDGSENCGECHEEGHNIRTCPVRRHRLF